MTLAIRFHSHGGSEVLRAETVAVGDPGPGEVRVRHTAVGLNLIDVYQRSGLFDITRAHTDLEARRTTGSTVLVP